MGKTVFPSGVEQVIYPDINIEKISITQRIKVNHVAPYNLHVLSFTSKR